MANTNAPRGLIPYRRTSGEPYNSAGNIYWVPSSYGTALFVGDPVQIVQGGADGNGIPSIQLVTAGNGTDTGAGASAYAILGAIMGRIPGGQPQVPILQSEQVYVPASNNSASGGSYVLVCDDPDTLYLVQENGNINSAVTYVKGTGNILGPGRNMDLVSGTGSTATGFSGWQLNSSTAPSALALQMRVVQLLQEADNAIGTNAKWLCRINLNQLTAQTTV